MFVDKDNLPYNLENTRKYNIQIMIVSFFSLFFYFGSLKYISLEILLGHPSIWIDSLSLIVVAGFFYFSIFLPASMGGAYDYEKILKKRGFKIIKEKKQK